jgi:hypothetical protein
MTSSAPGDWEGLRAGTGSRAVNLTWIAGRGFAGFQRRIKAPSTRTVISLMKLDKLSYTDTRIALNAADEALELLCRLRQIPLDSLSDAQLGEFFFNALEDELGGGAYIGGRI